MSSLKILKLPDQTTTTSYRGDNIGGKSVTFAVKDDIRLFFVEPPTDIGNLIRSSGSSSYSGSSSEEDMVTGADIPPPLPRRQVSIDYPPCVRQPFDDCSINQNGTRGTCNSNSNRTRISSDMGGLQQQQPPQMYYYCSNENTFNNNSTDDLLDGTDDDDVVLQHPPPMVIAAAAALPNQNGTDCYIPCKNPPPIPCRRISREGFPSNITQTMQTAINTMRLDFPIPDRGQQIQPSNMSVINNNNLLAFGGDE